MRSESQEARGVVAVAVAVADVAAQHGLTLVAGLTHDCSFRRPLGSRFGGEAGAQGVPGELTGVEGVIDVGVELADAVCVAALSPRAHP